MKKNKKLLIVFAAALVAIVAIMAVLMSGGEPTGIYVTGGTKYQYQLINPSEIMVTRSGMKGDVSLAEYGGRYVLDSATYSGETVGVTIDDKHFVAEIGEYVSYIDVNWAWIVSDFEIFAWLQDSTELNPELFEGVIEYADGATGIVAPYSVSGSVDGNTVNLVINYMDDDFDYSFNVPDDWGSMTTEIQNVIDGVEGDYAEYGNSSIDEEGNVQGTQDGYFDGKHINEWAEEGEIPYIEENAEAISDGFVPDKSIMSIVQSTAGEALYEVTPDARMEMYGAVQYMQEYGVLVEGYKKYADAEDFYETWDEVMAQFGMDREHLYDTLMAEKAEKAEERQQLREEQEAEEARQEQEFQQALDEKLNSYRFVVGPVVEDFFESYMVQVDDSSNYYAEKVMADAVEITIYTNEEGSEPYTDYVKIYSANDNALGFSYDFYPEGSEISYDQLEAYGTEVEDAYFWAILQALDLDKKYNDETISKDEILMAIDLYNPELSDDVRDFYDYYSQLISGNMDVKE